MRSGGIVCAQDRNVHGERSFIVLETGTAEYSLPPSKRAVRGAGVSRKAG
jgi:hypothetical protein